MLVRRLIAGVALAVALSAGLAKGSQVKRQYTTHTGFRVLFHPPSPGSSKDPPREVELHASADQGVTWSVVGTAKPSAGQILFRAPKDGEYWFMPRTKYASGLYLPKGPPLAAMKVVVDTTPPVVELDARNDGAGEVLVHWHVADANLKRETFKLEYKVAALNGKWQRVEAIDPTEAPPQAGHLSGETTVVLPISEQSAQIVVRAEASDEAGNRTIKEQPLSPSPSNVASSLGHDGEETDAPPDMATTFSHAGGGETQPDAGAPAYPATATPDWPAEESVSPLGDSSDSRRPNARPSQHALVSSPTNPAVQRLPELPLTTPNETPLDGTSPPPGVHPHLVNKKRFELVYDVDAVGSAGVVRVELWITADGGQTWTANGFDEDCRSPMPVKIDREGLYGFRVVIETTSGLRSPSPVSGDLPDIWVGIDLTPPEAKLISAVQGEGDEADRLLISWQADDRYLAARGISLRWAKSPQGPWSTVASGLENSGRYAWRLDQHLPPQVFLLLEARDDAGNATIDQLAEPVSLQRIQPRGHIREVRPLGAAPPSGKRG